MIEVLDVFVVAKPKILTGEVNGMAIVCSASSRFRGIRVLGYDFRTIASDPRFAESMALLEKYDLTFDVGGETHALEDVVLLAKTYPRVYDASPDLTLQRADIFGLPGWLSLDAFTAHFDAEISF